MKYNKQQLVIGVVFLIVLIALKLYNVYINDTNAYFDKCPLLENIKVKNISGKIVDKFYSSKEHLYPALKILHGDEIEVIFFQNEDSGFFEFVNEGDSLLKMPGSIDVTIVRGEKQFTHTLHYRGCQ